MKTKKPTSPPLARKKKAPGPVRSGRADVYAGLKVSREQAEYIRKTKLGTTDMLRFALEMVRRHCPEPSKLRGMILDGVQFNGLNQPDAASD